MIEVKELALGLDRGGTINGQICPKCEGGRNRDKSFSVSKSYDGFILYMCHRATCGYSGRIRTNVETPASDVSARPAKEYARAPEPRTKLTYRTVERINELYGLLPDTLNQTLVLEYEEWVCLYVYNPSMVEGGWEYRILPPYPNYARKSKHYRPNSGGLWYNEYWVPNKPVVIVEDNWSAMKVQQAGYTGIALLGTHMSPEVAMHIATNRVGPVILCLDKDATEKAAGYVKKYGFLFGNLRFQPIDQDLKWKPEKEIRELIGEATV